MNLIFLRFCTLSINVIVQYDTNVSMSHYINIYIIKYHTIVCIYHTIVYISYDIIYNFYMYVIPHELDSIINIEKINYFAAQSRLKRNTGSRITVCGGLHDNELVIELVARLGHI